VACGSPKSQVLGYVVFGQQRRTLQLRASSSAGYPTAGTGRTGPRGLTALAARGPHDSTSLKTEWHEVQVAEAVAEEVAEAVTVEPGA
jgi:hypothetical protein